MPKINWAYLWTCHTIQKVDLEGKELLKSDIEKKPEIPFLSLFGRIHAKFLKSRSNKHHGRN